MTTSALNPVAELEREFGSFPLLLAGWGEHRGPASALRDEHGSLSWAETAARIRRIAARLKSDGLARGQAVAILGTTTTDYALVYLAAIYAGGCAAPLTTSASPEQLRAMAADSGALHLFVDRAKLTELGDFAMGVERQIVLDEDLWEWAAPEGTSCEPFQPEPADRFNIIYSSGTTGTPKGIVHSHLMRWRQMAFRSLQGYGAEAITLTSTPLYSNTTLAVFLPTMFSGGCASLMGKFDTAGWLTRAAAEHATHTMLVPVQYRRLMAEPRFDAFDLSSMRMKYCTSAPFPAELKAEVLRRMPGGLIEIYSMTEGGVVCLLFAHEFPDKLHTVGQPAPGSHLKVVGEDGREVAAGEPGELYGRSPTMMSGYNNAAARTAEAQWIDPADGTTWMKMGDIGRVDGDGFVELVGRAKDVIISGGFNVFPIDLEGELLKDTRVAEAAVIGMPSDKWGETPVGFVVLKDAGEDTLEDIRATANARLGKTQRLALVHAIDEMPRSHIGKLLKTDLREIAAVKGGVA